jgi:hypothetical protein
MNPLLASFLGSWKVEVSLPGPKGESATRPQAEQTSQPRPGIWGHRRLRHAKPTPSNPNTAPGTQAYTSAQRAQLSTALQNRQPDCCKPSSSQRCSTAYESAACDIDSRRFSSASTHIGLVLSTASQVNTVGVLNRLLCPPNLHAAPVPTPNAPNEQPGISKVEGPVAAKVILPTALSQSYTSRRKAANLVVVREDLGP